MASTALALILFLSSGLIAGELIVSGIGDKEASPLYENSSGSCFDIKCGYTKLTILALDCFNRMLVIWWVTFLFLLIRFVVTAINFWFPQKLKESTAQEKDLVSILVPARNEEKNIDKLLRSIVNQGYKNYEVIVLDDYSDDNTSALVNQFRKIDPKVKLIQGKELPRNMLGKNWACHQLAQAAKGKYLLFLDADVMINSGLIQSSLAYLKKEELALLSVFPDQLMETREEKLVVPLLNYLLLSMIPLILIRKSSFPSLSAANGQCMLFDAAIYKKHQFHLSVGNKITEDIASMKLAKSLGYKTQSLLGNGLIQCRMYKSYDEGLEGFSKNILSGFGNSIPGLFFFLFFTVFSYVFFLWFVPKTNVWLCFIIIIYMKLMISILSRQNIFDNIVYHPWQMLSLIHISLLAIKKHLTKTIEWKGRRITT